jgi:hypothetical protein
MQFSKGKDVTVNGVGTVSDVVIHSLHDYRLGTFSVLNEINFLPVVSPGKHKQKQSSISVAHNGLTFIKIGYTFVVSTLVRRGFETGQYCTTTSVRHIRRHQTCLAPNHIFCSTSYVS